MIQLTNQGLAGCSAFSEITEGQREFVLRLLIARMRLLVLRDLRSQKKREIRLQEGFFHTAFITLIDNKPSLMVEVKD